MLLPEKRCWFYIFTLSLVLSCTSAKELPGQRVALVIGLNDYPACGPDVWLPYAESGAIRFSQLLEMIGFDVELIFGSNWVTKASLLDALLRTTTKVGGNGDYVFYYAGHIFESDTSQVLMTAECDLKDKADCLTLEEVFRIMRGVSAGSRILAVLDAALEPETVNILRSSSKTDICVVAAARTGQSMRVCPDLLLSVFTDAWIQGLGGLADENSDNKMTLQEISKFVLDEVREAQPDDIENGQSAWQSLNGRCEIIFDRPVGLYGAGSSSHIAAGLQDMRFPVENPLFMPLGTPFRDFSAQQRGMVLVPDGDFFYGCNPENDCRCPESPTLTYVERPPYWALPRVPDPPATFLPGRRVRLDKPVWIDRTEVTVDDYRKCVAAGVCDPPEGDPNQCTYFMPYSDQLPVNCVSWFDAMLYCAFVGKRLPTSMEWEKAARGSDGRIYPWGNVRPRVEDAVFAAKTPQPVCSRLPRGDGPYGICDLAGNVFEWLLDRYDGPTEERLLAGGAWYFHGWYLAAYYRFHDYPFVRFETDGFRCASDREQ